MFTANHTRTAKKKSEIEQYLLNKINMNNSHLFSEAYGDKKSMQQQQCKAHCNLRPDLNVLNDVVPCICTLNTIMYCL